MIPEPSIPQPSIPQPPIPQPSIPQPSIPQPSIPQPSIPQPSIPQTEGKFNEDNPNLSIQTHRDPKKENNKNISQIIQFTTKRNSQSIINQSTN